MRTIPNAVYLLVLLIERHADPETICEFFHIETCIRPTVQENAHTATYSSNTMRAPIQQMGGSRDLLYTV